MVVIVKEARLVYNFHKIVSMTLFVKKDINYKFQSKMAEKILVVHQWIPEINYGNPVELRPNQEGRN